MSNIIWVFGKKMRSGSAGKNISKLPLPVQRKAAEEWTEELKATGKSPRTLLVYTGVLCRLAKMHKKPFNKLTKQDFIRFLNSYENVNTKNLAGFVCKSFLKWLYGKEEAPEVIRWWKPKQDHKVIPPESMLTQDEIKDMLAQTPNLRDRCLLSVMYDSGCRVSEVIPLCRENVTMTDQSAVITVTGKTGRRRLLLLNSAPLLRDLLNSIPKAPGVNLWTGQIGKELDDSTVRLIARNAGRRINRDDVHPHLLRHSRASHLALRMSEMGLRARFGWTAGSNMTKRYVHLSGKDLDDEFRKAEGVKTADHEKETSKLAPVICPICKLSNDVTFSYCARCGSSLLPGMEGDLEKFSAQISKLMNDPQIVERAEKWHEADASGTYGPQIEREAQLLRFVASIGERQMMILRALGGLKQEPMFQRKSDEEVVQWARAELEQDMKKIKKPRGR
jgi:integrase